MSSTSSDHLFRCLENNYADSTSSFPQLLQASPAILLAGFKFGRARMCAHLPISWLSIVHSPVHISALHFAITNFP
jgi:hypothetical protein